MCKEQLWVHKWANISTNISTHWRKSRREMHANHRLQPPPLTFTVADMLNKYISVVLWILYASFAPQPSDQQLLSTSFEPFYFQTFTYHQRCFYCTPQLVLRHHLFLRQSGFEPAQHQTRSNTRLLITVSSPYVQKLTHLAIFLHITKRLHGHD